MWPNFSRLLKKWIPCHQQKRKKRKCFNLWLLQELLGAMIAKCQGQVLGNDKEHCFDIQNGNCFPEQLDEHQ